VASDGQFSRETRTRSSAASEGAAADTRCDREAAKHHLMVEEYFRSTQPFWKEVYEQDGLVGTLYRQRRDLVDALIEKIGLPAESQVLEVGCGAGLTTIGLARRGYQVQAVDMVKGMIESVRRFAAEANVANHISGQVGDVHHLGFRDNTFDMVIAIGVLEWVQSLSQPLGELTRVLKPGGHLIVNVDNTWALHCVLDPYKISFLIPVKRFARRMLENIRLINIVACPNRCSIQQLDAAMAAAGLKKVQGMTCAFGPFSFLGLRVLPDRLGVRVHHFLQGLADKKVPIVRSSGEVYLVLARK